MSNAKLISPPKLHDLKGAATQVRRSLDNQPMPLIMSYAHDERPLHYAQQIIDTVGSYIHDWTLGPDVVHEVATKWDGVVRQAQQVVRDSQTQIGVIRSHWTGPAAGDFSKYATEMLTSLNGLTAAAKDVGGGVSQLADVLTKLRDSTIAGGATVLIDLLNGTLQYNTTIIDALNAEHALELGTGALAPLALAQICLDVVSKISDQLSIALKDVLNFGQQVDGELADIRALADQMHTAMIADLPKTLPSRPGDIGDTTRWHPAN
jgi:uncharacterized protein YukE